MRYQKKKKNRNNIINLLDLVLLIYAYIKNKNLCKPLGCKPKSKTSKEISNKNT